LGLADGADRPGSAELLMLVTVAPTQIDDRDVEVADRGQELERPASVLGLLDLISIAERLADAQASGRVRVYDQAASVLAHSLTPDAVFPVLSPRAPRCTRMISPSRPLAS